MAIRLKRGIGTNVRSSFGGSRSAGSVERQVAAAEGQALSVAGAAIKQLGVSMAEWQQLEDNVNSKANKADINNAKAQASNILNRAAFEANKTGSQEAAVEVMNAAIAKSRELNSGIRNDEARASYDDWINAEAGSRALQADKIGFNINQRATKAKEQLNLTSWTSSAIDDTSLVNNKANIEEYYDTRDDILNEEAQLQKANAINEAEANYTAYMLNNIDVDNYEVAQYDLNKTKTFVEKSEVLTPKQKQKAYDGIDTMNKQARQKQIINDGNFVYHSSKPQTELGVAQFGSKAGYTESLKEMNEFVNQAFDDYTDDELAIIKDKAQRQLKQDWDLIQIEKTGVIDEYLKNPSAEISEIPNFKYFSYNEQQTLIRAKANSTPMNLEGIRGNIAERVNTLQYNPENPSEYIKIVADIKKLSQAEQKVYNEILSDNISMQKKGPDYSAIYNTYQSMIMRELRLTGNKATLDDVKIGSFGSRTKLTYQERLGLALREINNIKKLGDDADAETFIDRVNKKKIDLGYKAAVHKMLQRINDIDNKEE